MEKLVPLDKKAKKKLGIVDTKQGLMIDKKKLVEIKKFQRAENEDPKNQVVVEKVNVKDMIKESVNHDDEARGIY